MSKKHWAWANATGMTSRRFPTSEQVSWCCDGPVLKIFHAPTSRRASHGKPKPHAIGSSQSGSFGRTSVDQSLWSLTGTGSHGNPSLAEHLCLSSVFGSLRDAQLQASSSFLILTSVSTSETLARVRLLDFANLHLLFL